mgnify:CR=1 FL=1
MKNNPYLLKFILCFSLAFTIGCSNNDDDPLGRTRIPLFAESDLSTIHDNASKQWQITGVINNYYNPNYSLEIELSCLEDDVYTFFDSNEVTIDLGEAKCFGKNDDGIFTADIELFSAKLLYMNKSDLSGKTIFLEFSRGYVNNDNTAMGSSLRWYKLAELTEDRMVFYRERGEFVGEYTQALIFERM